MKKTAIVGALTAQAALLAPAVTFAQDLPETQLAALDVATAAAPLGRAIRTEISNTAYTTVEDYEGAILFVLGQQDYPVEVAEAALDITEATPPELNEAQQTAIDRVRRGLRNRQRGTGAILGGGSGAGGGFGGASFSFPVIGIGGGGSNYTQ